MSPSIEAVVEQIATELELPGVAVAVVRREGASEITCWGLSDVARDRRVEARTAFRIGSITKTMTTLLVLRQIEAGRLGLDDPVTDHVDLRIRQPRGARPITVRDLLTHRSGLGEIPSWRALRHPLWAVGGCRPDARPSLARLAGAGFHAEAAPGTRWVYSNPGYTILGLMVEALEGRPFAEALRDGVLAPCAMDDTTLDPRGAHSLAVGHVGDRRSARPTRPFDVATVSAGGVISTVGDLASYAHMLLDGGAGRRGRVVAPDLLDRAFTVQYRPHPQLTGIGLTFRIRQQAELTLVGHNGSMPGWNAALLLCPQLDVGVAVLANRSISPGAEFGAGRMANAVLQAALDLPSTTVASRPSPVEHPPARSLCGTYRPPAGILTGVRAFKLFGGRLHIRERAGRIEVQGRAGPLRLARPLHTDVNDPVAYSIDLFGVRLKAAFDRVGQPATMWLDGLPLAFELTRHQPDGRRRVALAAAAGTVVALRHRRQRVRRRWSTTPSSPPHPTRSR